MGLFPLVNKPISPKLNIKYKTSQKTNKAKSIWWLWSSHVPAVGSAVLTPLRACAMRRGHVGSILGWRLWRNSFLNAAGSCPAGRQVLVLVQLQAQPNQVQLYIYQNLLRRWWAQVLSPSPAEDVPVYATAASFGLQLQTHQTFHQDLAGLKEYQDTPYSLLFQKLWDVIGTC